MSASQEAGRSSHSVAEEPEKPWKVIGYRGFSALLGSDNDFMIFRRFGALNARILLLLQDEIAVLEQQLHYLDAKYASPEASDIHNGSFRLEALPQRSNILSEIQVKIQQYSTCPIRT